MDVGLLFGGHVPGSGSEQGHQHLAELDELTAALPVGALVQGAQGAEEAGGLEGGGGHGAAGDLEVEGARGVAVRGVDAVVEGHVGLGDGAAPAPHAQGTAAEEGVCLLEEVQAQEGVGQLAGIGLEGGLVFFMKLLRSGAGVGHRIHLLVSVCVSCVYLNYKRKGGEGQGTGGDSPAKGRNPLTGWAKNDTI